MPTKPIRLADVAKAAGVSHGTASNVFSRPAIVREEVRERVMAAAQKLGYGGPDPKGRLLRAGKVNAIGVAGRRAPLLFLRRSVRARRHVGHLAGLRRHRRRHLAGLGRQQGTARLEHPERAGRRLHRLLHRGRLAADRADARAQAALRGAGFRLRRRDDRGDRGRRSSRAAAWRRGTWPNSDTAASPCWRCPCRIRLRPGLDRAGQGRDLFRHPRPAARLFRGARRIRHRYCRRSRSTRH